MEVYIQGIGNIFPCENFNNDFFPSNNVQYTDNFLKVADTGYKNYIDPKQGRRMSRVIKMGVSAAKICLADAEIKLPGAIVAGTGLGCIEDTERFLSEIIKNNEQLLTPTSFIQSTHNTVAAQIALLINCHASNFTYVHRGFSFELAIHDAIMQLKEGLAETVLTGAIDELTPDTFIILKRLGLIKKKLINSRNLYSEKSKGTIYGEGAAFFLLANSPDKKNYAKIKQVQMLFKPESEIKVTDFISKTIQSAGLNIDDIDLVIGGMNGDPANDAVYRNMQNGILKEVSWIGFKHLCGEYHTASAFAIWLAAKIIREQFVPPSVFIHNTGVKQLKNILVYNHFLHNNHAAYILQSC